MKKIVFVVPILLLTGCTSDVSIGPIGFLDIGVLACGTIILLIVGLERFGPSKFSLSAGHLALTFTLFALGLIVGSVGRIVFGVSKLVDIVLSIISLILIFGAIFTGYRAFKEERRRKNETQTED